MISKLLYSCLMAAAAFGLALSAVWAEGRFIESADVSLHNIRDKQERKAPVKTMDKDYTETEMRNLRRVKASFEDWRKGTGSPYALLVPNAKWTIVGNSLASKTYQSKEEFMDEVIVPFNARMSKRLVPTVRALFADGDMVIALFDAEGTARDSKPYKNTYSWFLKMRDGMIVESTAFFDSVYFNDLWVRVKPAA